MRRPRRATVAGRVSLDLQRKAREDGRPTDELLQLYVLEAFIERLARSSHREHLVLKGGALLAAFETRRPTRDIDVQGEGVRGEEEHVLRLVKEIVEIAVDDGVVFVADEAAAEPMRNEEPYPGIRVSLRARLDQARVSFHVDFNLGDPISPPPAEVNLPRILGGSIPVRAFPLSMIYAEKLVTAISRGVANTRWRDFADIVGLSSAQEVSGVELVEAIHTVAAHRSVELLPLASVLEGFAAIAQPKWAAWRRRQKLDDRLPDEFSEVLAATIRFADPAIEGGVTGKTWDPSANAWR